MDYCKFENTAEDLARCVKHLKRNEPMGNGYEEHYRQELYELAKEYIQAYDRYSPEEYEEDED